MLEAARQKGVKKFVYASSSSVYGDESNLPKREGIEGNLLSPYAVSKRCDEEWAKQYTYTMVLIRTACATSMCLVVVRIQMVLMLQ